MPFQYSILLEEGVALGRLRGDVSARALIGAIIAIKTDPLWRVGLDELWDVRDVKRMELRAETAVDISNLPKLYPQKYGPAKVAIVVRGDLSNSVAEGFLETASIDLRPIRLFWSLQDAAEWLDLAQEVVEEGIARLNEM